jgi:hypothetical protein
MQIYKYCDTILLRQKKYDTTSYYCYCFIRLSEIVCFFYLNAEVYLRGWRLLWRHEPSPVRHFTNRMAVVGQDWHPQPINKGTVPISTILIGFD